MMMIFLSFFFFIIIMNKINKNFMQFFFKILLFMNFILMFFMMNYNMNYFTHICYDLGFDKYSFGLICLTLWIYILMMMVSNNFMNNLFYLNYMFLMLIMLLTVILCFSTLNLILFYLTFEFSLLPMFFLILGWGIQPDRIMAGMYMMTYTLFGSLPLLFMIIYIYLNYNTLIMNMINIIKLSYFMFTILIVAFLFKMPMYSMHLWLPKAHVESPIMGSMLLAGVMLKLGSYGLLRMMFIMQEIWVNFNEFYIYYGIYSGIICSFLCLCQNDMKMLVAYSSIVHMSILLSGMMTFFYWGIYGSFLMMIAHGLVSSGMFCLVNVIYERTKSRSFFFNKGLMNIYPSFTLMWFLICSSNLSFPPSLNLFSEIMLFNSLIIYSKTLILFSMMFIFLSSSYNLFFFSSTQHGKYPTIFKFNQIKLMEYMLLLFHWIPLNIFFNWIYLF
nr:NADH deshydrogenase subunit 4 [Euceros kiushuensis]